VVDIIFDLSDRGGIARDNTCYSYEKVLADTAALKAAYGDFVRPFVFGHTVEGRELIGLQLGNGPHAMLVSAGIHAREYVSSALCMRMAADYCRAVLYNETLNGISARALASQITFYLSPMSNPDGVNVVLNGTAASANQSLLDGMLWYTNDHRSLKTNARGVDINRNFPPLRERTSGKAAVGPSSESYYGPYAASEPETQALMALIDARGYIGCLSLHAKGEVLYWIEELNLHFAEAYRPAVEAMTKLTGYTQINGTDSTPGTMTTYASTRQIPCICLELCPHDGKSLPYDDSLFESNVWSKTRFSMVTFAW